MDGLRQCPEFFFTRRRRLLEREENAFKLCLKIPERFGLEQMVLLLDKQAGPLGPLGFGLLFCGGWPPPHPRPGHADAPGPRGDGHADSGRHRMDVRRLHLGAAGRWARLISSAMGLEIFVGCPSRKARKTVVTTRVVHRTGPARAGLQRSKHIKGIRVLQLAGASMRLIHPAAAVEVMHGR